MAKKRINVTMTDTIADQLDATCLEMGINRSALVTIIIKNYLDSQVMLEGIKNNELETMAKKLIKLAENAE